MQNFKSYILFAGVLAAAMLVGGVIGWLGGAGYDDNPPPASVASTPAPLAATPAPRPAAIPKPAIPVPAAVPHAPVTPAPAAATNWDEVVQAILDADTEDAEKAKQLFALFPKLPPEEQVNVVENLSGLVPDENYAPMGRLLTDAKLPAPVLEALMADALGRPNAIMLPLMLEVARNPAHSQAAEAKDTLTSYLEKDYGSNWAQWQQQIAAWLKDNPD